MKMQRWSGNSRWQSSYMVLSKNCIQHTITSSLACKKEDNACYAVTGVNKQKANMLFWESASAISLQLFAASADVEAKILLKKPGILLPDYFRVPLPHHSQEKNREKH